MLSCLPMRLLFFLFMVLSIPYVFAINPPLPLEDGWQYRWGDSPFNPEGVPAWTQDPAESPEWSDIGFPSNPPDRKGRQNVWFRVTLPEGQWWDPVLYIYSVDLITEAYLDGQKIYQHGTFDAEGKGLFEGWPWHMIPLPEGFGGKSLYFRIYSNYSDIGLWGEVKITNRQELILSVLSGSIEALIVSGFSFLVALLSLVFSLSQTSRKQFAAIALFAFGSGLMILSSSQASQLLINRPLLWDFLGAGGYYSLPIAIGLLMEQWVRGKAVPVVRRLWQGHLLYLVGALGFAATGLVNLSTTFPVFDGLLLISLGTLFTLAIRQISQTSLEQKAILGSFVIYGVLLIIDMAVAHGFLPWGRVPLSWGGLCFALAAMVISLRQYHKAQQEVIGLNQSLERKVMQRTEALERMAAQEKERARILSYEHEKTILLNDLVARLQGCHGLDQGFEVLARSIPEYTQPLSGALYRRREAGAPFRLQKSWGYEDDYSPPQQWDGPSWESTHSGETFPCQRGLHLPQNKRYWCFPIRVEDAEQGSLLLGFYFVAIPAGISKGELSSGKQRLFLALQQATEKLGIVLSSLALREQLQTLSYEDGLTGLKNRRYFNEFFAHQAALAQRNHSSLSLIMADLDHFKNFNDRYGHEAGDYALQILANTMKARFRETDIVCRFGGEEFVIILPGAAPEDAKTLANQLLRDIRNIHVLYQNRDIGSLSLSAGIASWPDHCEQPEALLTLADNALYQAKTEGWDRVCLADDTTPA